MARSAADQAWWDAREAKHAEEDNFGAPTKADDERMHRDARARDKQAQDLYDAGRSDASAEHSVRQAADARGGVTSGSGRAGAGRGSGSGRSSGAARSILRPTPARPPKIGAAADNGAGFLLGAVLWALVSAYLKEGPAGPRAWLAAKFLNRSGPAAGPAVAPRTGGPSSTGPSGPLSGPRVAAR